MLCEIKKSLFAAAAVASFAAASANAAPAGWDAFVIRDSATVINEPATGSLDPGSVEFIIDVGGKKAALGTSLIDGTKIGDIGTLKITRSDGNVAGGSVYAPYMNFWITDGAGRYAVIANEPSNPEWVGNTEHDTTGADLATKSIKLFEFHPNFTLPAGTTRDSGSGALNKTFADFADYVIAAPSAAYMTGGNGTGGGAPDDLVTNQTYGFNWVFGDTQGNYNSGSNPGYIVSNPIATAVPEPASIAVVALGGAALLLRRRRRA